MSRYREAGGILLRQALTSDFEEVATQVTEFSGGVAERIDFRIDEDDLETSSFGLLFALAVFSFAEARPRGVSGVDYEENDEFGLEDLLLHLRFEGGNLMLSTDYLRGRMMKTDVTIGPDGSVQIVTRNRGEAASRWVMRLQGKKVLRSVEEPGDGWAGSIEPDGGQQNGT
jgi:hypothetical protein